MRGVPSSNIIADLVKLASDDIKGCIIGKDGRNIKSFELATGTTLVIDESAGSVMISSFDPVRREIAKLSLKALIQDGWINPTSIEETVLKVEREVNENILGLGEKALEKLNIYGIPTEILKILGCIHYRLSNNQNALENSIEVTSICLMLALELRFDLEIAKRCGLYHDMGKAINDEIELSHAMAAAELLRKHREVREVINATAAIHEEVVSESIYTELLKIADCISATRLGARSDSMDGYLQKLHNLRNLASSFEGVQESYAIQAGREVRVIMKTDMYPADEGLLAGRIKKPIEAEMNYPRKLKLLLFVNKGL